MMEERCEPARCLEVLRTVCKDENKDCSTQLVRECGQRGIIGVVANVFESRRLVWQFITRGYRKRV
jgi:hypothetical protein